MALTADQRQRYGEDYIRQAYREFFKRDPTPQEVATVFPTFGTDPNVHDTATMRSYVAQLAQQEQNAPQAIDQRRQEELAQKAPQFDSEINDLFTQTLGRPPSAAERQHFSSLRASGIDAYEIGDFLKQLPEYGQAQDKQFRDQASGELQGQDQQYFTEKILPAIQSQFAQSRRSVDSSGYAAALAQAATQQNRDRESFLSNLSASQYQGRTANARADYESYINRLYGNQDYNRARTAQLQDQSTGRLNDIQDFNFQQQAYEKYLRNYGKRGGFINNLSTGLNLANSFANLGKGWSTGSPVNAKPTNYSQAPDPYANV